MSAKLVLSNGTVFHGKSFGAETNFEGEVVFSTNMAGYVESLTDPSFCCQILCLTFPLIGNYGVPAMNTMDNNGVLEHTESSRIWAGGLLVSNLSEVYSHHQANRGLADWLKASGVPGLFDIDTRELVRILRTEGTMNGKLIVMDDTPFKKVPRSLVSHVSCKVPTTYGNGDTHIALVDCGVKNNIIRSLLKVGFKVTVVPHDFNYCDSFYDGIFLSNGPGNPSQCEETIRILRRYLSLPRAKPVFGICLGNQLLGLAAGATIKKMVYGNRGYNQPVLMIEDNKTYITSQNHGYAVDSKTLPKDWTEIAVNKNDGSNEGIRHVSKPFRGVQFHPEARGGPDDTMFMFQNFYEECVVHKNGSPPPEKIILLGSGGLNIGQAGEFDYSRSQAVHTFKERGYSVVLVNPNIASIQTTDGFADQVYYVPVTPAKIETIIRREKPKYIALSFGGQTALNCGVKLYESGVLHKYGVQVLGTSIDSIRKTEDRDLFSQEMTVIGQSTPKSRAACSMEDAHKVADEIGYPVLVRAAFALGGLGSGFCKNKTELTQLLTYTFSKSHQVLIDEDLRGWKEVEYEVMRDSLGNSITVCNMENFDPLGIHTGDSIVVAPSQTLSNDEYNSLRRASLDIADHLGIVGECNVQIALDPYSSRYKIIEVNPRLSRSSALASKATGYPIAAVAARLCLNEPLHAITNAATGNTTANFEPSLDYIVTKIPKWDTRKFEGVDPRLGSAMKSVGEVMALGRSFEESFQKGLRMATGYGFEPNGKEPSYDSIVEGLRNPSDDRVRLLAYAYYNQSLSIDEIHHLTKIDKWFLFKLDNIYSCSYDLKQPSHLPIHLLTSAKKLGFSDATIGRLCQCPVKDIVNLRRKNQIAPSFKQIDTLAGEYESSTNYMYSTYCADSSDSVTTPVNSTQPTILVLGSGKYRIGSSVEFDYCSVKCADELRRLGYRTVMVNYNPETLSTDFNKNDVLFFEEISVESIVDIYEFMNAYGVVVSVGGQEPNNIALELWKAGLNIVGTHVNSIDRCENRSQYSSTLDTIGLEQPRWASANNIGEIRSFVSKVGFPLVVRPSYVLSGAAMRIVSNQEDLQKCIDDATDVSPAHPVVLTEFITNATEVDVDAVANNGDVVCYAICEHLEKAGVHSGDATLLLPPKTLTQSQCSTLIERIKKIAGEFNISGPFNTQFLIKDDWIGIIETNLRASRSFPLVSKAYNKPFIEYATRAMVNASCPQDVDTVSLPYCVVKAPKFSFNRLPGADPKLRIEMSSTGEVGCWGSSYGSAFISALVASQSNVKTTQNQNVLVTGRDLIIKNRIRDAKHTVISPDEYFDWTDIDMVVDSLGNEETKEIRRNAIDRGIFLVTELDQLELLLEGLEEEQETHPYSYYKQLLNPPTVRLFVRQSFTECSPGGQERLQKALDSLVNLKVEGLNLAVDLVNGSKAENKDTFKASFENQYGLAFTPENFRQHRLRSLGGSDAMVIFRTGLSESTVFEVAYNCMCGSKIPVFFAVDPGCEIKTTLLRELDGFNNVKHRYKVISGGVENIATDPDFIHFLSELV